jgi:hypothetical protein
VIELFKAASAAVKALFESRRVIPCRHERRHGASIVSEARRDRFLDADSKAAATGGALMRGCFSDAARMMQTLPSLPVAKVRVTLAHPPERRSRV